MASAAKSPRQPKKNKKSKLVTPEAFTLLLKTHVKIAKVQDDLLREAQAKGSGNKVTENGKEFKLGDIKAAKTINYARLVKLGKVYRKTFGRVRPDRMSSVNGGLIQPVIVGESLRQFFNAADLGTVTAPDALGVVRDVPIRNILIEKGFLGENPIASGSILTSLLVLYMKRHSLSQRARDNLGKSLEQQNGQLLSVDETMNTYLNDVLTRVEQQSAAKLVARGVQDGQRKSALTPGGKPRKFVNETTGQPIWNDFEHAFKRDNFAYGNLQSIYRADVVKLNGTDERSINDTERAAGNKPRDFLIRNPLLGKTYMKLVDDAVENGVLGKPGFDYADLATQASMTVLNKPLDDVPYLQLRAGLDRLHDDIAIASMSYVKTKSKPKSKSRPKKKATAF